MSIFKMALQNLKYRNFRSAAMIFFVFVLSSCLFVSLSLLESMESEVEKAVNRMGADIIISPGSYGEELRNAMFEGTPCTIYFNKSWAEAAKKIEGVKTVSPQLYIATMQESPCCDMPSQLIGFEPQTDFIVKPWLEKFDISSLAQGEVIIGSNFLSKPGDVLKFYDTPFKVAAKMEPTGLSYDTSIFLSFESVEELLKTPVAKSYLRFENVDDLASMIMVDVESGYDITQVKLDMDFEYRKDDIEVSTANSLVSNAAKDVSKHSSYSMILSIILFSVVTLALLIIFTITVNERKNEFGILYTIGATKSQMSKMISIEGLLISVIGGVLGIGMSWGIMAVFRNLISLKWGLPNLTLDIFSMGKTALVCFVLSALTGIIASSYSALAIARFEPYALTRED